MKNVFTKIWTSILAITLIVLTISPVYGDNLENLEVNEACFDNWQYFVSSQLSFDEFSEYWKDLFDRYSKNSCHYNDINQLTKQLDAVSKQIKDAFLKCSADQAVKLEVKYNEIKAELFYVRNFIDIPVTEIQTIPDEKVYSMMRTEFVLNSPDFTEEELKTLFDKFKTKYKDKISARYGQCKDTNFEELKKKWDSFVKNIKSMGDQANAVKDNWGKAISTPSKAMEGFVKGIENMRLNNIPSFKTPDQVVTEIYKEYEKTGAGEPTIVDIQLKIIDTSEEYVRKIDSASVRAEYEAKYKKGNDTVASEYDKKIQEIIDIINATFEPLSKLKTCTKKGGERQCQ